MNVCFLYEPFYVGKGNRNRKFVHLFPSSQKAKTRKNNKIKIILKEGYDLRSFILQLTSWANIDVIENEIYLINIIGRQDHNKGPLTNGTDGGDGRYGWSEEQKIKQSKVLKGKTKGYKRTEETKVLIREARKLQIFTKESYEKRSKSLTGRIISEKTKKKQSEWIRTKEIKKKISESLVGHIVTKETREAISIKQKLKTKCISCGFETSHSNFIRYHKTKGCTNEKNINHNSEL